MKFANAKKRATKLPVDGSSAKPVLRAVIESVIEVRGLPPVRTKDFRVAANMDESKTRIERR